MTLTMDKDVLILVIIILILLFLAKLNFKSNKNIINKNSILHFSSPEAAFEYCENFMDCSIYREALLPCIVEKVTFSNDHGWLCAAKLAGNYGVVAVFPSVQDFSFVESKLCMALIGPKATIGEQKHSAVIVAMLQPSYDFEKKSWIISKELWK